MCQIPSGCCSFTGPWTVTRSSLRMLRRRGGNPPPPCRCTPQRSQVSAGVGKPSYGLGGCIWMPLVNGTGNSPVSGTADPRSSQTGQVIRGLR